MRPTARCCALVFVTLVGAAAVACGDASQTVVQSRTSGIETARAGVQVRASAVAFAERFPANGAFEYNFDSLQDAVGEADLVVTGRVIDVHRDFESDFPIFALVVAVDEVLAGRLIPSDLGAGLIEIVVLGEVGQTAEDLRAALPAAGIAGVHILHHGPTRLDRPEEKSVYAYSNQYTVALRGDDGEAISFGTDEPEVALGLFGGRGTTYEDALAQTVEAARVTNDARQALQTPAADQ